MALIVEDGSIVANANTYVSAIDYTSFLTARGESSDAPEIELIRAMDYLESLDYLAEKESDTQPLQFPRGDGIPANLIKSQMFTAFEIKNGNDPMASIGRQVKSEKLDSMQVTYSDTARDTSKLVSVMAYLTPLLNSFNGASGYSDIVQLSVVR